MATINRGKRRWTAADDRLAVAWTMTLDDVAFALERTDREVLERLRELDVLPQRQGPGDRDQGPGDRDQGPERPNPKSQIPNPQLPAVELPKTDGLPDRGAEAMELEAAEAVARRVLLHLYRGCIDAARAALEDGWRTHTAASGPLPTGQELLEEPVARVIDEVRVVNLLEGAGIATIGQLLEAGEARLLAINNFGDSTRRKVREQTVRLRALAGLPPAAEPPTKPKGKPRGRNALRPAVHLCRSA